MNPIRQAVQNLPGHWIKGAYNDARGNHCGIGHMFVITEGTHFEYRNKAYVMMGQAARDKFPDRAMSYDGSPEHFPAFNDHPDTTEQDVVAVMNLAADRWDVEHG